jgi:hypothetical protein
MMSIPPGEDIGLEVHPNIDQFLRIQEGHATVKAGASKDSLTEAYDVKDDWAFIHSGGHVAQRDQHREEAAQALHRVLAGEPRFRDRAQDEAGRGQGGSARAVAENPITGGSRAKSCANTMAEWWRQCRDDRT